MVDAEMCARLRLSIFLDRESEIFVPEVREDISLVSRINKRFEVVQKQKFRQAGSSLLTSVAISGVLQALRSRGSGRGRTRSEDSASISLA